jgi:hypothetical protein
LVGKSWRGRAADQRPTLGSGGSGV